MSAYIFHKMHSGTYTEKTTRTPAVSAATAHILTTLFYQCTCITLHSWLLLPFIIPETVRHFRFWNSSVNIQQGERHWADRDSDSWAEQLETIGERRGCEGVIGGLAGMRWETGQRSMISWTKLSVIAKVTPINLVTQWLWHEKAIISHSGEGDNRHNFHLH